METWRAAAAAAVIGSALVGWSSAFRPSDDLLAGVIVAQAIVLVLVVGQRREAQVRLHSQVDHDPLTGLPNRARFLAALGRAMDRAKKSGAPPAVLFLDLDRFKVVNDGHGHAAGDRLLVQMGERLRGCLRQGQEAARLGGDEFTILVEGSDAAQEAEAVAARVAEALTVPFVAGGGEFAITASIGIAVATPEHDDPADLLRDADEALYRAKSRGKARWAVYDPAMRAERRERAALEADLEHAPIRGELWLAYQPIVDLASGAIVGLEALVRWQHPQLGLLPPGQFIPLAEETGQVETIGRWVLAKACRQAKFWQSSLAVPPVVAVNLSAQQFQRPDLVETVAFMLRGTRLDPRLLKLEITESAVMGDTDAAVETLHRLKALGVGLAIDDFGTGYSSLGYLRRFPVDALKIDRSFVSGIGSDAGDAAIAEAVVGLAHTLGLEVVAEGIETSEQMARLQSMGCEQGQGYRFGRPQPPAAIETLLQQTGLTATGLRLAG